MANLAKIYREATSLTDEERESMGFPPKEEIQSFSPSEMASVAQSRIDWLSNPVTADLMKHLGSEIERLELDARELACTYHSHFNHYLIIQKLMQSQQLRKLLSKYGR